MISLNRKRKREVWIDSPAFLSNSAKILLSCCILAMILSISWLEVIGSSNWRDFWERIVCLDLVCWTLGTLGAVLLVTWVRSVTEVLRLKRFLPCLRGEKEDLWVRGSECDTPVATSEGEFGEKDDLGGNVSCNSSDLSWRCNDLGTPPDT